MAHSAALEIARRKMAQLSGVKSATVTPIGSIEVVIGKASPQLVESVRTIAREQMMPISIKVADQPLIEQKKSAYQEWVDDYFTPIKVPGFAGEPREAPPEEIAPEPKGALKLQRLRAKTRGRPVVAWKHGDQELRKETPVRFSKEMCLQWTLGRTLTVRPGATAKVKDLSSRRPIVFVELGEYQDIELPVHMLGYSYHVDKPKAESIGEAKKSALPDDIQKIMKVVGLGMVGWGEEESRPASRNDAYDRDGWILRGGDDTADATSEDVEVEDVELPVPAKSKKLIVDRKK